MTMDESLALQESFGMVAQLIGPQKWIPLARQLNIYEEGNFDSEVVALIKRHKNVPVRIWSCLMGWKLSAGRDATVDKVIEGLHAIEVHWLARSIRTHLENSGFLEKSKAKSAQLAPSRMQLVEPRLPPLRSSLRTYSNATSVKSAVTINTKMSDSQKKSRAAAKVEA